MKIRPPILICRLLLAAIIQVWLWLPSLAATQIKLIVGSSQLSSVDVKWRDKTVMPSPRDKYEQDENSMNEIEKFWDEGGVYWKLSIPISTLMQGSRVTVSRCPLTHVVLGSENHSQCVTLIVCISTMYCTLTALTDYFLHSIISE